MLKSLRAKYLPAAAGLLVWAGVSAAPFAILSQAPETGGLNRNDYNRAAALFTLLSVVGGGFAGSQAAGAVRGRLNRRPDPSCEAEVVEQFLYEQFPTDPALPDLKIRVSDNNGDFQLHIRYTRPLGADDTQCAASCLAGIGLGKDTLFTGANVSTNIPQKNVIMNLDYTVPRNALPPALKQRLADFQEGERVRLAVAQASFTAFPGMA